MLARGVLIAALVAPPSAAAWPDGGSRDPRPEVWVGVPAVAPTPGVTFPFGGAHHEVPGVVAVNRPPYYCEVHAHAFRERSAFLAHLRRRHHLAEGEARPNLVVDDGQVRYVGK